MPPDSAVAYITMRSESLRGASAPVLDLGPWWCAEHALALHEVPALLPPAANGEPRSVSSVYRWTTVGLSGVRLRRFRAAGRGWATTREELARWQAAITAMAGEDVTR